jgi:DNA-binding CsgD family transcriptional regulator
MRRNARTDGTGARRVAGRDTEQGLTVNGSKSDGLIDQRASELIRELYLGAETAPAAGFRRWALAQARRFVPFRSAIWGTGSLGSHSTIDAVELDGQTPEMLERYRRRWLRQDVVAREVLAQLGSTVNLADRGPREQFLRSPFYRQFGRRYGIAHALSTAIANRALGLVTIVSWWRDDSGAAFTEAERQFKQFLMPHLVQACGINTFLRLRRTGADGGAADPTGAYALATERGLLTEAEPDFTALLQRARPDWRGPALPAELRKPLRHPDGDEHTALGLHLRVTRSGAQIVLRLREPLPIDRLSPAERRVAQQLAGGLTHRQIAAQLSLAPSTVRNHLHTIYRKLGVANRVQMVNELHVTAPAPAPMPPEPR